MFFEQLLNGLTLGSTYSLIALVTPWSMEYLSLSILLTAKYI